MISRHYTLCWGGSQPVIRRVHDVTKSLAQRKYGTRFASLDTAIFFLKTIVGEEVKNLMVKLKLATSQRSLLKKSCSSNLRRSEM
jgi:hypothetical protein